MELTSTRNPLLQKVRRAATTGRPTEDGLIVAEGPHLLAEANRGAWAVEQVFTTRAARERHRDLLDSTSAEILEVSERALASAAATDTPQNILSLLRPRTWTWRDLQTQSTLIVVLDRIQDPGNLGTIVRSAEAFGASGLVFLKGCARVANGKVLRAAAGSLFRMPFLDEVTGSDLIQSVLSGGLNFYALAAHAEASIAGADLGSSCALLVGSEGSGVAPELLAEAKPLCVPTGAVESLNAAVACSIALYEAQQQRRRR